MPAPRGDLEYAPDLDDIGFEFHREAALEFADEQEARAMSTKPYTYGGAARSLSPEEAAAEARRNGLSPAARTAPSALATSREARAAVPTPAEPPSPAVKGAVKVDVFPDHCRYPFAAIAADGGIWRLDPAEFGIAKPESLRTQALSWARKHNVTAKTAVSDGHVYVQFGGKP
jgi:hypothetical protein